MAKKVKTTNTDVIEIEAEEIPLEETINKELVKNNVTEAVIAGLKNKYGELRLSDIEDKETFLEIKDARKDVRQYGILAERICKKGRESAIQIQKLWLSKEKEVLAKIAEVQDPLDAEIKKFEDEVERKEQEKIRQQEEAFMQRQSTLLKYGAVYANGCFNLGEIQYESSIIKEADQDIWETSILPKYKVVYERNESVRVEEERKRFEDAEKLRKDQEEMERQKKELEDQQRILREQQDQLKRKQEDSERNMRLLKEQEERRKRDAETAIINKRVTQLAGVTWNGVTTSYSYNHEIIIKQDAVLAMSDDEFESFKEKHNTRVANDIKKVNEEREAAHKEQIRLAEEQAAQRERERIAEEERQKQIQLQQEEEKKQKELEAADDKTKWSAWINEVFAIPEPPNMKSAVYKNRVQQAKQLIDKITSL